ncbi:MAG: phosphate ABC transporter substrate-binding protein PstS [Actinobacteria bacterium]|jgi:phosphate transport system substrate-binding protein|nr:phosphate ABC transporter substrate-binding protein PstS [Actinomycetota bacterium]HRY10986.1 phosphate ABC transporter substrate-binding protein PstS [Candidatus Nanopelagicales bacterium]
MSDLTRHWEERVKLARSSKFAVLAATGALALVGCASGDSGSTEAAGSIGGADCATGTIKASGSSAQKNAMTEWINAYQTACEGATIEYSPSGSSAGRSDFINNQVAFSGSDKAMAGDELTQAAARCDATPPINIPMVGGAIALTYNVEGVDNLVLTPDVTAKIFNNQITNWNDPALAAVNPGVSLPDAPIAQFHRSDGSGTTENFTQWMSATAPDAWPYQPGSDWTARGGQGSKGSDGVAASVKSTPNSIGYVELSFVETQGLNAASVDNGGGPVAPNAQTATAGLASAKVTPNADAGAGDLTMEIDYTLQDPAAYPVLLLTYEIVCESGNDADTLPLTQSFLTYTSSTDAQAMLSEIGYVPLPSELETQVAEAVNSLS